METAARLSEWISYGLIVVAIFVIGVLLFFIKRLYLSLKEAQLRNKVRDNHLMLSVKVSGFTAWSYDTATRKISNIYGNDAFDGADVEKFMPFIHTDDRKAFLNAIEELSHAGKDHIMLPIRVLRPRSGSYIDVECSMHSHCDESGNVFEIISIQKVVTEAKIKQKEHDDLVNRCHTLFDNDAIGLAIYDNTGRLIDINPKACSILGIENKDELIESHPSIADNPNITDDIKDKAISGESFSFVETLDFARVKLFNFYTSSLKKKVILEQTVTPTYSSAGEFSGFILSSVDITDRAETEETLRAFHDERNAISESFPIGIAIFDNAGTLRGINSTLCRILGSDKETLLKMSDYNSLFSLGIPANYVEKIKAGETGVFSTSLSYDRFKSVTKTEKSDFNDMYLSIHYSSVIKDGKVSSHIIVVNDITEFHLHSIKMERMNMLNDIAKSLTGIKYWAYYSDTHKLTIHTDDGKRLIITKPELRRYVASDNTHDMYKYLMHLDNKEEGLHTIDIKMDLDGSGVYRHYRLCGGLRPTHGDSIGIKSMGYMLDTTSCHELESKYNDEHELNRMILDNTESMLVYATPEGEILWENVSDRLPIEVTGANLFPKGGHCFDAHGLYKTPCRKCLIFWSASDKKSHSEIKQLQNGIIVKVESAPVLEKDKTVKGIILRVTDITEQKNAEVEIANLKSESIELQELFHSIVELVPTTLFVKDISNNFNYLVANRSFCNIMNVSQTEIIGKNDFDVMPRDIANAYYNSDLEAVKRCGKPFVIESYDEHEHYIRTTKVQIDVMGKKMLLGIVADISEIKAMNDAMKEAKEVAEISEKQKSAFFANVSREIITPINEMVQFSHQLKEANSPEEHEKFMTSIDESNNYVIHVIKNLRDLSDLDAGYIELHPAEVDIEDIFAEIADYAKPRLNSPNIRLITDSKYKSCTCAIDKARLSQIWSNFVSNACKCTKNGHISIGYDYRNTGLYIYVEDTGVGIDPEKQHEIFTRFGKVDSQKRGNGLGLAISKSLVELFGGKIGFTSEFGKGSYFWAWIPVECNVTYK